MEEFVPAQGGTMNQPLLSDSAFPPVQSHFLRLPLELRDMIYEHLLVASNLPEPTDKLIFDGLREVRGVHKPRVFSAILHVNRQINVEAARVLYGGNVFCLTVNGSTKMKKVEKCGNEECAYRKSACWVHRRNISLIRHLQIDVSSYYNDGHDFTAFQNLAKVCRLFASLPPLKTLVVKYHMLLGEERSIKLPKDAKLITTCLREDKDYEKSYFAKLRFKDHAHGAYSKLLLALTLLRATHSVTVEPLVQSYDIFEIQSLVSGPWDDPPRLSKQYAQFLEDKIYLPSSRRRSNEKVSVENDIVEYDSGVEL